MTPASRFYRFWLRLLPSSFRDEFADEMTTAFLEQRQRTGGHAVLGLWIESVTSLLGLAFRLRIDQLKLDLRDATRSLLRNRTHSLTAMATLALALGPATSVFSVVQHVLLDPLPGADLRRVVYMFSSNPSQQRTQFPWSELAFLDHRERRRGLASLAAFTSTSATFGGETPQQVLGAWVSPDMLAVLGVAAERGRGFEEADTLPGATPTIVLGHDFAQARFGDREAVGESLLVDGRPTTVIGVLPAGLHFPSAASQFWQPLVIDRATSARGSSYLTMIGRLEDGATPDLVLQYANSVAVELEKEHPDSNTGVRVEIIPAPDYLTRSARRVTSVLGLAASAIFLLAFTNIASLMVVKIAGRSGELSVRAALGASRARLTRQLLMEQLLISAVSAVVSMAVAHGLLRLLAFTGLVPATQIQRSSLDSMTLLFLATLMILTASALGWVVSRRASRSAAASSSLRTQSSSREVVRLRQALIALQVSATVVLLIAAGLLIQSAARLVAVDPGFRTDNVITFALGIPPHRYPTPADRVRLIDGVVERLSRLPGVTAASSAAAAPMTEMRGSRRLAIDGRPLPRPGSEPLAIDTPAGPDYAAIMGLRILDGRWISPADRAETAPVIVISETFAKEHFPGERPIGRRLRFYAARPDMPTPPMPEIVGVVSDVRQFGMAEATRAQMYVPQAQRPFAFASFFVKTQGDPSSVIGTIAAAVRDIDPERPVERLQVMKALVDASTLDRRALSGLLFAAALIALLISTVGVYGVAAAVTAARRRELAIRAAIGAERTGLLRLVVQQAMLAAVVGVAVGVAAGIAVSSVLETILFSVRARDPITFLLVALALLIICGLATYLPARRAVAVNPAEALRAE